MKRAFALFALTALFVGANAHPEFFAAFESTYRIRKDSNLGKARCLICHTSKYGGKRNLYGKDVEGALKAAKARRVTAEVLQKVEGLDSSRTGETNIAKIKSDRLPCPPNP